MFECMRQMQMSGVYLFRLRQHDKQHEVISYFDKISNSTITNYKHQITSMHFKCSDKERCTLTIARQNTYCSNLQSKFVKDSAKSIYAIYELKTFKGNTLISRWIGKNLLVQFMVVWSRWTFCRIRNFIFAPFLFTVPIECNIDARPEMK